MALPVTALFAGLLGLWIIFLATRVVRFRLGTRISLGFGDDPAGERLIRGHANAVETIPIFLIMLGLAEGLNSPHWFLYGAGAVFTIGRVMHGTHFLKVREGLTLRFYGMIMTVGATVVLAFDLLRHVVGR